MSRGEQERRASVFGGIIRGSHTSFPNDDQRVMAMTQAEGNSTPGADNAAVENPNFAVGATIAVAESDQVIATVNTGPTPRDVETTSDGRYLLVGNQSANTVTVLAASNYSVVATVPVGTFPCAISVAPDGSAAYVTNRNSNSVSIVNLTTLEVANVPVGTFACDVMVSPDGHWVIVTNRLSGNVTIIDTSTTLVAATVATGTNPQGVDFAADSSKAYVTNATTTSVIDMSSFTVVATIANVPSGTCAVGATMNMNQGDQGRVYIASNTQSGVVRVLDVSTNTIAAVFPVGVRPLGIGIRTWPN